MTLSINTNMMAVRAARNLGAVYQRLAETTENLSTGLRIRKAADDPANMAVRELMRADIVLLNQGLRNATDGVSLIQTADGAMAVIDEKLIRMRELAEQAATGTYTTAQRELMNSEYQSMAREIDRIANATTFNGTKLLNGDISLKHGGYGLKIHFGQGNDIAEDYYYINIGDFRATESQGLRVGGDAKNDIHLQNPNGGAYIETMTEAIFSNSAQGFAFGYNYDLSGTEADLAGPSYLAGVYNLASGSSLQDLIDTVNQGTQSRIRVNFGGDMDAMGLSSGGALDVCLGDEVYQFGSGATATGIDPDKELFHRIDTTGGGNAASALAAAITNCSIGFWAVADTTTNQAYVFRRAAGDMDHLTGCDMGDGSSAAVAETMVTWTNMETWVSNDAGASFGLGGESWVKAEAIDQGGEYCLRLTGRDVGEGYDVRILDPNGDLNISGLSVLDGFNSNYFDEVQNAADTPWRGGEIRSQSSAQEALDQIMEAIIRKDTIRTQLGTYQTRLENTITHVSIYRESLQQSESRISDLDMAKAMTEQARNNIISQAAVAMLSQSNTSAQLALSLIL